jgi:hypothetical protein
MFLRDRIGGSLFFGCVVVLAMITSGFGQGHERTSFTKEELLSNAYTWLADLETVDTLHIYKLSCPTCILELKGAFDQNPKNLGAINFSTFKKEDRPIAQALIATTLSHTDKVKRADTFGDLLNIFVNSASQFHSSPKQWLTICFEFWNTDEFDIGDKGIWADALNWMDRQNRTNMLMEMTGFPGSLELKEVNPIPPIREKTYRDGYVFVALSLPWLKYPEVHPVKGQPPAANHPQNLPTLLINPLEQFPAAQWRKHADIARKGAFWHFIGEPELSQHPRMTEFLAAFLDMPTDAERREAFANAIETIAGTKGGPAKSILATIPRVKKDLPVAAKDRKESRMEEAKKMIGDFLIYDTLRRRIN